MINFGYFSNELCCFESLFWLAKLHEQTTQIYRLLPFQPIPIFKRTGCLHGSTQRSFWITLVQANLGADKRRAGLRRGRDGRGGTGPGSGSGARAGAATVTPSTAPSTEMAGVMTPSP